MLQIHVNVSKPYNVTVGRGILSEADRYITGVCPTKRAVLVCGKIPGEVYGEKLQKLLENSGFQIFRIDALDGEKDKTVGTLETILEFMAVSSLRRNDTVIALGGGVTGDTAGLASALYMRGTGFIQIPTTLLSMVDASVGGKTAVNLAAGKNMAGAFHQPDLVLADTEILGELPEGVFNQGMGEVIKHGIIAAPDLFERVLYGNARECAEYIVERSVEVKKGYVENDEFDTMGIRNVLNAGHTIGHAIEKLSGYNVSHGQAVGTGLAIEAEIAESIGLCTDETAGKIRLACEKYGLLYRCPWTAGELARATAGDKKNRDENIVFELPETIGKCTEVRLGMQDLAEKLDRILSGWQTDGM